MNTCIFVGRLTSDIELRHGQTSCIGTFSLAVDGFKDKDGNQTTDFLPCQVFGDTAERMERWVRKGTKVIITARAKQDRWTDRDGKNHSSIKFTVSNWEFAESKAQNHEAPQTADKDGFVTVTQEELPFN